MSRFKIAALLSIISVAHAGVGLAQESKAKDTPDINHTRNGASQKATTPEDTDDTSGESTAPAVDDAINAAPKVETAEATLEAEAAPESEAAETAPETEPKAPIETKVETTVPAVDADRGTHLKGALKAEPGLEVQGQLAGLFTMQDDPLKPGNEFSISRARIELSWTQWDLIRAVVKVEAEELFEGEGFSSILRDLYVRVQPIPELGVRLGQFKKPFSRITLSPWSKSPLIKRGIVNKYVSGQLMYGGRDIGVMLEGRLIEAVKLDYEVGVFNGMGRNTTEIALDGGKDIAGRLEAEPVQWFEVGASASFKFIHKGDLVGFVNQNNFKSVIEDEYPLGYSETDFIAEYEWMTGMSWMAAADVAFTPDKWRIAAEGMLGENWWFEKYPTLWSAALMVSYKWKISKDWPLWIEPAVRGETFTFMDEDMADWRVRLWQVTPGINLHIGKHVRLMIDGEFVFAQGSEADIDGSRREGLWPNEYSGSFTDSKKLLLQLAFEI